MTELKIHWMANILPKMSEKEFQELKNDIEGLGQLEPILTFNGEILDGRHRYRACKEIGIEPWVEEFEGGMSLSDVIRSLNVLRRHLTPSQRAMVAAELLEPYEEQAKKNQIEAGKNYGENHPKEVVVNLPQPLNQSEELKNISPQKNIAPKATDVAAKDWGVSGKAVRDAKTIIERGTEEQKEKVKTGKASVSATAKKVRYEEKKKKEKAQPKKMNFTNDNIEWAKWSWNPVTGCKHGCAYCYARDIANRFSGGFDPKYHPDRLDAPANTKIPEKEKNTPGINNVFVCSMADLFGGWVYAEWIQNIIDVCDKNKQWSYLFLTKNPKRYLEFNFPDNCWLGATADTQKRADTAIKVFRQMMDNEKHLSNIKFLSCEPLLEEIVFDEKVACIPLSGPIKSAVFDWIIIGGQSKTTKVPEFQPQWEWVEHLLFQVRKLNNTGEESGIKVYFKPNLTIRPKEYPKICGGGKN